VPYIRQERRAELDDIIDQLGDALAMDGDLNYVLFALCKRYVHPSYNNYKNYLGELGECIAEIRRRILVPYEEERCKESGDVKGKMHSIICEECKGTGSLGMTLTPPTSPTKCSRCGGTGKLFPMTGDNRKERTCDWCGGAGEQK